MSEVTKAELEQCRAVCAKFEAAGYYRLLGMTASSDAPGRARVALPFRSELVQLYGAVHGGALLSVADAAVNLALATTLGPDETTSTIDLSMSFVAPALARDVEATAMLTRRGRRVSFAECLLSAGGEVISRAKAVLYVSRLRGGASA
jgi:uncharacterized protein (TIGR00369 family)